MENHYDPPRTQNTPGESGTDPNRVGQAPLDLGSNCPTLDFGKKRRIEADIPGHTICRKCGIAKPDTEYYRGRATCKSCTYQKNRDNVLKNKDKTAAYNKAYAAANREKMREYKNKWRKANLEKARECVRNSTLKNPEAKKLAYAKRYYADVEKSRAYAREKTAKYLETHREAVNARQRERSKTDEHRAKKRELRKTNVEYRLRCVLRKRINEALRRSKKKHKPGSAIKDLGCGIKELKAHLEARFTEGMTWDNHGLEGWHIDHIIPLAAFDLSDKEQFLKAVHYTNLQPLWATDNLRKGDKV